MKMMLMALSLSFVYLLAGCKAIGPDYETPEVALVDTFTHAQTQPAAQAAQLASWWETYGDEQLNALIEDAIRANADLEVARLRIRQARIFSRIAQTSDQPNIDLNASYTRFRESENNPSRVNQPEPARSSNLEDNLFKVGLDASWEIDIFGGLKREQDAAAATIVIAEEAYRDLYASLASEVAMNYFDHQALLEELKLLDAEIAGQGSLIDFYKRQYEVGLVTEIVIKREQVKLNQLSSARPNIIASKQLIAFRLAVLLGMQAGQLKIKPAGDYKNWQVANVPVGLPSTLLQQRADIRQAEQRMKRATAEVGVATADLYPKFFLTGAAGLESVNFADLFSLNSAVFAIGPSIQWPIFRSGAIKANVAAKEIDLELEQQQYKQAIRLAVEEVEAALVGFAQEELRRRDLQAVLDTQASLIELLKNRYDLGLITEAELLGTRVQFQNQKRAYVQSLNRLRLNQIALFKALGGGWPEKVKAKQQ